MGQDLMAVRKEMTGVVERNLERKKEKEGGNSTQDSQVSADKVKSNRLQENVLDHIEDMREYAVP
jgi:hypothetical protein